MDLSKIKDSADFILIPPGTVVEAIIMKTEVKPGKKDPRKKILHLELHVSEGKYIGCKINDTIVVEGAETHDQLEWGLSKLRRIVEYGRNANPNNMMDYQLPEKTGVNGTLFTDFTDVKNLKVGIQTKLDSFISNRSNEILYSNKVEAYASKLPESPGYKLWQAIESGEQPWQQSLPERKKPQNSYALLGSMESPPLDAYSGDF